MNGRVRVLRSLVVLDREHGGPYTASIVGIVNYHVFSSMIFYHTTA